MNDDTPLRNNKKKIDRMAFEATKREWSELYAFFRLLADGKVSLGTPQAKKEDEKYRPIAMIQREEHDGTRRY